MKRKYITPVTDVTNIEVKQSILQYSVQQYRDGGHVVVGTDYSED